MKHLFPPLLAILIAGIIAGLCSASGNDPNHIEIVHSKNRPRPESPDIPVISQPLYGAFPELCGLVTVGVFKEGCDRPEAVAVTDSTGRFRFDDVTGCKVVKARQAGSMEVAVVIDGRSEVVFDGLNSKAKFLKDTTPGASDRFFCQYLESYMPSKRVKDNSGDAYEMLYAMAVPEMLDFLSVDVRHRQIETLWGLPLEIFIDRESLIYKDPDQMRHAAADDLSDLSPESVKMVEYADLPDRTRPGGLRRVINIVVK